MSENTKIDFKKLLLAANIKQEPGVNPPRQNRLPSFKGVRDLNLNSQTTLAARPSLDNKSRKVITPNLNVQRNKNKVVGVGGLQLQGKQQQQNRGRDRGRGRGRGRAVLIQSSGGVFSEGVSAESISARRERSSFGKSDSTATDYIPKPKLNLNHKIDKEEEEHKLNQLLKDDFLDDPTLEPDSSNAPVTLPNLRLAKVKVEVKKEEPEDAEEVLPGGIKIKKEKLDHDEKPPEKKHAGTKLAHWLDDTKAKFVLLQLPDTLPGHKAEAAATTAKPSTASKDPVSVSETVDQACTLRQLPEGQVGKLQVLKSGNVRLVLGKTVLNVFPGTEVSYKQVAMSVDLQENSRGGDMINLGPIVDRLVCTPDWETLLNKCTI